jgi:hypothetical protein
VSADLQNLIPNNFAYFSQPRIVPNKFNGEIAHDVMEMEPHRFG